MDFLTTTKPLSARVKQRYSDFIVEEIYLENNEEKKCEVKRFNIPFEERGKTKPIEILENKENKKDLILILEKINTDTNYALSQISRGIGVSKNRIGYAGLKDKRAITSQRISVYEPNLEKIKKFGVKGLELRNPVWGERIELGDLVGNEFNITLRNISLNEEEIKKITNDFNEQIKNGIPNFFGTQRFGGKREVTHLVGKELLKENYKEAIMLYLTKTFEEEKEDIKKARINLAKTLDFKNALKEFSIECRQEKAILNSLIKNPTDFLSAFKTLPKKTQYLFTHAYQSYLFNKIIKKRMELLKENPLIATKDDEVKDGVVLANLIGYETKFSRGIMESIEKEILNEEGIDFSFFKIKSLSELSSKGSKKEISLFVKNFKLEKIFEDEFNEGKKAITISFFLTKGNYATTVLRELIKEEIY